MSSLDARLRVTKGKTLAQIIVTVKLIQANGTETQQTVVGHTGDNLGHPDTRSAMSRTAAKAVVGVIRGANND